jgi:3-isopropylmalate dehydratase small subunit
VLLVISIVVSVVIAVLFYNNYMNGLKQERWELTSIGADARNERERVEVELKTYGVVDATAGTVRIPLDAAKERVLKKYEKK